MIGFASRKLAALLLAVGLLAPVAARAADLPKLKVPDIWEPSLPAKYPVFGLDWSKYPEERKALVGSASFPRLGLDFEVVAPSTGHPDEPATHRPGVKQYNCIAWTIGATDRWVWPGDTLPAFDALYAGKGYKRLKSRDTGLEFGVEKVVLYGTLRDDGRIQATHAAWQEPDGTWSSKLGGMARIKHPTPEAVGGGVYGDPIAVYTRPVKLPPVTRLGSFGAVRY